MSLHNIKEKWKTCLFIIGLPFYIFATSVAQNQKIADSLRIVYASGNVSDSLRLPLLRNLAFNEVDDFDLALSYADELIQLAEQSQNQQYLFIGYYQKGNKKKILGDLDEALEAYLSSIEAARKYGQPSWEGSAYGAIADIYNASDNHDNAVLYYHKAIDILREAKDSINLASVILNAGDEYLSHENYDTALLYFKESGLIFEKINHASGEAYNLGNIGMVYANTGKNQLAEQNINKAIVILEQSNDYYPICFYLLSIADIYSAKGDAKSAISYASRSLELAIKYQLKQQISDAHLKLSTLYEKENYPERSLQHYRDHIAYRDSVNNIETVQKLADLRTQFEVDLREKEIDLLEKGKTLDRIYIMVALILLALSMVSLLYFRQRFRTTKLVADNDRKAHTQKINDLISGQETRALQSMVQGQESERKRLAQDLHNHFGSLLATIKVNVNGIDEDAIPNHSTISTLVDQACADIRNMSHELNMGISKDFGLVPALKELTSHVHKSGGLKVDFTASMYDSQLDSTNEILIYRIVQELLSNTMKHAEATQIWVSLTCFEEEKIINIMVQDNGKGFDTKNVAAKSNGMGLQSLNEMISDMNGEITFDSNKNSGTTVTIDLPITTETELN